jgi:hypothetical protein
MKHLVSIVLSIAVTAAALAYAVAKVNLGEMVRRLAGVNLTLLPALLALLVVYYYLTALNWTFLLRPLGRYTVRQAVPPMMIGFAGNNVLPARMGELVRTVVFARRYGASTGGVLASLLLERVLDVLSILVLYFLALPFVRALPAAIGSAVDVAALVILPVCVGIVLFLGFPGFFMRLWAWPAARLPQAWAHRGTSLLNGIVHGLSAIRSPRRMAAVLAVALLKWCVASLMLWAVLASFGVFTSPGAAVIVLAVTALAVALPSAPGFVGTLQAAFVFALTPFGVSPEAAFAASVYYMLVLWVAVTATGALCFLAIGIRARDLRREVEQVETGADEA